MSTKFFTIYFALYLSLVNSSIFLLQGTLYNLRTDPTLTHRKVCLVIIDGLRYDGVSKMPFLSKITATKNGKLYKGNSGLPSNSRPGYERILTGTTSYINNIDSNYKYIPSLTPNLFSLSKENGLKTAFSGFFWFYNLYPIQIDNGYHYYLKDDKTFKNALSLIYNHSPDFIVVHPLAVDCAGHKNGGTSNEYINCICSIDNEIHLLWNNISKLGYTMVVVSDHGHRDKGGHGDDSSESTIIPIALIDSRLFTLNLKDNYELTKQIDIAPTICDIMGLPKTIYMTGNSLINTNSDMSSIRKVFMPYPFKDFESFFNKTSNLTNILIALECIVYFTSMIIAFRILELENKA